MDIKMFPGVSKLDLCAAGTSIIIITQECFPRILIGKYYSPLSKGIKKNKMASRSASVTEEQILSTN